MKKCKKTIKYSWKFSTKREVKGKNAVYFLNNKIIDFSSDDVLQFSHYFQ